MKRFARYAFTLSLTLAALGLVAEPAVSQGPAVRAVLFFSPTCPHCHEVIQQDLPVIFERHGGPPTIRFDEEVPEDQRAFYAVSNGTLQLLLVDVSLPEGGALYRAWAEAHHVPREEWGVPRLVIADTTLVGSRDIPDLLPAMIEAGLAGGGIDWPKIAGFEVALAAIPGYEPLTEAEAAEEPRAPAQANPSDDTAASGEEPAMPAESPPQQTGPPPVQPDPEADPRVGSAAAVEQSASAAAVDEATSAERPASALASLPSRSLSMADRFRQDRLGNSFSVIVLVVMVASLIGVALRLRRSTAGSAAGVGLPLVALVGALVAAYLTYIESSGATAVCGPVGDCNTVNQSEYAALFGLVPVGLVGLVGYLIIIWAWVVHRLAPGALSDWAVVSILGMSIFGTLLSLYLTFLEPFVIGATCAWCLTSAVAITLLMWLSARPGKRAWLRLTRTD